MIDVGEGAFVRARAPLALLPLFLVVGSGLFLIAPSNQAGITTVSVFPSTVTTYVGQNFSIDVNVTGVSDLYGWEFKMNWTASLLNLTSITEGSFLKSGGQTFFYDNLNVTGGQVTAECTLEGDVEGISGSGGLATLTFNVKSSGQSPLNLYYGVLINSQGQTIPSQLSGGYVHLSPAPDVAVTSVTVSPTALLPGNSVNINATVQNLGGSAESFNVTAYTNSHVIGVQEVALNSSSLRTLFFTWDTTGYSVGDYRVSAVASTVPGEMNTTNNAKAAASNVTILYNGHYIAVTSINPGKTVIGQGYSTSIRTIVKNYGTHTETFNTTAYLGTTKLQTQRVTLQSGVSTTLNFTWNTAGFSYGNYTVSANVTLGPSEANAWIGPLIYGIVKVTIPGDINGDGVVNAKDASLLATNWLKSIPPGLANADINGDGIVNARDLSILCAHWLYNV